MEEGSVIVWLIAIVGIIFYSVIIEHNTKKRLDRIEEEFKRLLENRLKYLLENIEIINYMNIDEKKLHRIFKKINKSNKK